MRQQNLDGKTPITPAPFDAYEKVARVKHEEAPKEPGHVHSGLQPVIANSAEEEKAYTEAKAEDAKAEPKAE